MRILASILLLACTSCSHPPPPSPPPPTPGPPVRVACRNSVTDYCAANACDPTLTAAEQDRSLCPATLAQCNDVTAIARNGANVSTVSYYSGGQLVAVVNQLPRTEFVCQGGPDVFVIPTCSTAGQSLPACGP